MVDLSIVTLVYQRVPPWYPIILTYLLVRSQVLLVMTTRKFLTMLSVFPTLFWYIVYCPIIINCVGWSTIKNWRVHISSIFHAYTYIVKNMDSYINPQVQWHLFFQIVGNFSTTSVGGEVRSRRSGCAQAKKVGHGGFNRKMDEWWRICCELSWKSFTILIKNSK